MDTLWLPMLPFLVFFVFLAFNAFRRPNCPDCGAPMPLLVNPFEKTRRIWLAGGYICAQCGCETNISGQKVTAESPAAPFPMLPTVFLALALTAGIGLGACLMAVRTPQPALRAARVMSPPLAETVAPAPLAAPAVPAAARR